MEPRLPYHDLAIELRATVPLPAYLIFALLPDGTERTAEFLGAIGLRALMSA